MSYYDALVAKWATLQGSDDERVAAINGEIVKTGRAAVPISGVMTRLRSEGVWLPIKAAAASGESVGAAAAVDLNSDLRMQTIDFDLPIVGQMLADLVQHSLLTQAQADALNAMGDVCDPWWMANGYASPITMSELEAAGLAPKPQEWV